MSPLFRYARKLLNVRREQQLRLLLSKFVTAKYRTDVDNVYHCCVWKTASQWIRNVLSSMSVYRHSGLLTYAYELHEGRDLRPLQVRSFDKPFPLRRIVSPLYISHAGFAAMPKPAEWRAFFVARDPRDLVVSHYFSSKYSHLENPGVLEERAQLEGLSEQEGMAVHLTYMAERGIFDALRSWAQQGSCDPRIKLFRFEDLVGKDQREWMMQLVNHCDILIPEEKLDAILQRLSFKRLSGGREQGSENKFHKYRSGTQGDWQKYFDDNLMRTFGEVAGDVCEMLGYR
jgi:hypothetical protein